MISQVARSCDLNDESGESSQWSVLDGSAITRTDEHELRHNSVQCARKGPQQAIVATAHKIARIVYHLLKYSEAYEEQSAATYEEQWRERELSQLTRRAQKLGYTLTPEAMPALPPEAESTPA